MRRGTRTGHMDALQRPGGWLLVAPLAAALACMAAAASTVAAEDWETPQTRLRPIGSPSAVDAFNPPSRTPSSSARPQASWRPASAVRQAAMMQAASGDSIRMPMPGDSAADRSPALPAPLSSSPAVGPIAPPTEIDTSPLPRQPQSSPGSRQVISPQLPQDMVPVPRWDSPTGPAHSGDDYAPLAQPQLGSNFAMLGNCRNISAPSGYRSDRILSCGPPAGYVTTVGASAPPPTYLPPPAQLDPPFTLPATAAPPSSFPFATGQTVIPGPTGHRPLISFGQERYPVQIGQGIFGQPAAYVPGQTFRNAIRYLTW